jgi:hypothetical protein
MSRDILTTWGLVLRWERQATADARSLITVEDVFADACAAYLDRCAVLAAFLRDEGAEVRVAAEPTGIATPGEIHEPDGALVGVSVVEVRPSSFDMAIRVRPAGDGDGDVVPVYLRRTLVVERRATGERLPIPRDVRDEFIALQLAGRDQC